MEHPRPTIPAAAAAAPDFPPPTADFPPPTAAESAWCITQRLPGNLHGALIPRGLGSRRLLRLPRLLSAPTPTDVRAHTKACFAHMSMPKGTVLSLLHGAYSLSGYAPCVTRLQGEPQSAMATNIMSSFSAVHADWPLTNAAWESLHAPTASWPVSSADASASFMAQHWQEVGLLTLLAAIRCELPHLENVCLDAARPFRNLLVYPDGALAAYLLERGLSPPHA